MIEVYTVKDVIDLDLKLYTFLVQNNILTEFILGLNTVHDRDIQHRYWNRDEHVKCSGNFNMFTWTIYNSIHNTTINWCEYYDKYIKEYSSIIPYTTNFKLIKLI